MRRKGTVKLSISTSWILTLYMIAISVIYIFPSFKITVPYLPSALLMLAVFPLCINTGEKGLRYAGIILCSSFLLFLSAFFLSGETLTSAVNEAIRNLRFFVPAMFGIYLLTKTGDRQKRLYLLAIFVILAVILVNSLVALQTDPMIARVLAQDVNDSSGDVNVYRLNNIGGFGFSYTIGIVAICLVYAIKKINILWFRLAGIVVLVLLSDYIYNCQYTMLLILTLLGCGLILFTGLKSPISTFIGIVIILVIGFNLGSIFSYFASVVPGQMLSYRLDSIATALNAQNVEALGSRVDLMGSSLSNWLSSPIVGNGSVYSTSHSLFVTYLEAYGVVGFSVLVCGFAAAWKVIAGKLKELNLPTRLFNAVTLYVLILSVLNPIGYVFEIAIVYYSLVPCVILLCEKHSMQLSIEDGTDCGEEEPTGEKVGA